MRVVYLDQYVVPPGTLLLWSVPEAEEGAVLSEAPPSFNQGNHVNGAAQRGTWLAVSFEIAGPLDRAALASAYQALVARHGTLSSSFIRSPGGVQRLVHPPVTALELSSIELPAEPAARSTALTEVLDESCRPTDYPAYFFGAIEDPGAERATVLCGFDHVHTDAYSLAMVLRDLHELYAGFCAGEDRSDELPEVGSHLSLCVEEATESVPDDDPRIAAWHEFFDVDQGGLPQFPLDLGVPVGTRAPQQVDVIELLDDDETGAVERACAGHGVGLFAAVFAACARATAVLAEHAPLNPATPWQDGHSLRALIPVHTRRAPQWRDAVGWFVTNGPLDLPVSADFTETVLDSARLIRQAVDLSKVTLRQVVDTYPGGLRHPRSSVFMVSYIDYRALPLHAEHRAMNAHHISASSDCDDLQVWASRSEDGLAIRVRYPRTDQAVDLMRHWLSEVETGLRSL